MIGEVGEIKGLELPERYIWVVQMPLMMARPRKNPKTGIYEFRRVVPDDLRGLVKKREEKRSLGTRDLEEAKRLHAEHWLKVDSRWANLKFGQRTLTEREAHAAVIHIHDQWLAMHRDHPSLHVLWRTDLYDDLWTAPAHNPETDSSIDIPSTDYLIYSYRHFCFQHADSISQDKGWTLDRLGRRILARAIAAALQRASLMLKDESQGIYSEPVNSPASPASLLSLPVSPKTSTSPYTFETMLGDWKRERQPRPRTIYEMTSMIRKLEDHLGFSDVRQLTPDHLVGWKDALRASGLSARTIRNGKLAAIRAMLAVAVQNRRLPTNPADGVVITVKREPGDDIRDYTDDEAVLVLTAASSAKDPVRRWIPLLCAYSGARLSEICHLRVQDIEQIRGIPTMSFSPEAGPIKNRASVRIIPIHPAVIEAGFLDFVSGVGSGPLFAELKLDRFGKRSLNGAKVIGRWIRKLGLTDELLSPSHSWRHRFKTLARVHGLAVDVVDAMLGHTRATVGDGYGRFPPEAMLKELSKVPRVN